MSQKSYSVPDGWTVQDLSTVAEFLDSKRRPIKESDRARIRGEVPYYGATGIVGHVIEHIFNEELILLGEDGENILSRKSRQAFIISGKSWVNNHAHVLRPRIGANINYLCEFLESLDYTDFNTGTAQPKLNKQVCSTIQILLPPIEEQRATASALSDMDALLAKLDQLIAKKRDIKQAAMQDFFEKPAKNWTPRKLADISAFITKGSTPTTYGFNWETSGVLFLRSECVSDAGIDLTQSMHISPEAHAVLKRSEVLQGDLLMTITGNVGRVVQATPECDGSNINQHIARIRINDPQINSRFVYHYFSQRRVRKDFEKITTGQAYPQLSLAQVRDCKIPMPDLPEQNRIAGVLSDMDTEITALEARREKTRLIKQGMMQELLSGRVRLA